MSFDLAMSYYADINIESPPSMHPCKRICDITGYVVCALLYEVVIIGIFHMNVVFEYSSISCLDPAVEFSSILLAPSLFHLGYELNILPHLPFTFAAFFFKTLEIIGLGILSTHILIFPKLLLCLLGC